MMLPIARRVPRPRRSRAASIRWPLPLPMRWCWSPRLLVPGASGIAESASRRHRCDPRLRRRAVRQFADALPDPCIVLDRRSSVVHRNPAARAGTSPAVPRQPDRLLAALPGHAERHRGGAPHRRARSRSSCTRPCRPRPGTRYRRAARARSIRCTKASSSSPCRASPRPERLEALRTDFVANASHELRTPLTSLVGFIDTLLGPAANDTAAREKFLDIMRAQAARMSKLIDDLLSLEPHRDAPARPPHRAGRSRPPAARGRAKGCRPRPADAGVTARASRCRPSRRSSRGDRDELYEVFENLIDNAIKYGGDGGKVEVALAPVASRPRLSTAR